MPIKNTAITITLLVWDFGNNCGKTGQEANITLKAVGDLTGFTPSLPAIDEVDAINRKGEYWITLTAGENNYDVVSVGGILTVAVTDCEIIPTRWVNESADLVKIAGHSIVGTGTLVADAFEGMFNVASPQLTVASKNQSGDSYPLVSTEVAEILADTNELQGLISDSKIASQVKGMDADVITASALKTDAVNEITAAIWAKVVDGTITFEKMSKILLAFTSGKVVITSNSFAFYDQSNVLLFTLPVTTSGRIPVIA